MADTIDSSPAVAPGHGLLLIGLEHETPGTRGSIAALDLATGALAWQNPVSHAVHGSPVLSADGGRCFIGTNDGELLCLDTATGSCLWRYLADGAIRAAPAYSKTRDVVVAGSADHCIHLVDGATGRSAAIVRTEGDVHAAPLIVGDVAFVGSQDKTLYAIDIVERRVLKSFPLGARIFAAPALLNGLVFVGTTGGKLFGIDPITLSVRDVLQLPDRIVNPPVMTADGGTLVVPVLGNRLFAFRAVPATTTAHAESSPPADRASEPKALGSTPFLVDGAIADGTYFRLPEPAGRTVSRPFARMPSRQMLGAASLLMMHAAGYRDLTQDECHKRVLPALIANQARVFLYGSQPIGMVTWASLTEQDEARLVANAGLPKPEEWSTGDRIWVIDVVAPFGGGRAMVDKVRRETLRGRTVSMLQPRKEGGYGTVRLAS